jgi:hypothetical protein
MITVSKWVMGDFNFPKIDWKNWLTKGDKISENFVESIRDSYLFQHVMENTRIRDNCEHYYLDFYICNPVTTYHCCLAYTFFRFHIEFYFFWFQLLINI